MMKQRPVNDGQLWTRDQLILAFELYCRIPFGRISTRNPLIRELAIMLGRTSASVSRKLGNFGAFDPVLAARNVSGLTHGSRLDKEIWDEFHRDWNELVVQAHDIKESLEPNTVAETEFINPKGPSEQFVTAKQRLHQSFFRDAVISSYESKCCITGISVAECLVAGHIIPWRVDENRRADPTNGLCLSATFERLFDAGLMAIDSDFTLLISKRLRCVSDIAVVENISNRHGQKMLPPKRFFPDAFCLQWHRDNIYKAE